MASRPVGGPAFEDLTARARIRDAALRLFAERGIDGATIRDIASAAGVSPGLVRHHFGNKDALRDACDTYALDKVMGIKYQAARDGIAANPAFLPGAQPVLLLMMRYFARSMVDGSPGAGKLYDRMVTLTEQWLAENRPGVAKDSRAFAAVLVGMQMGPIVMHEHLSRALGMDTLSPAGQIRMSMAIVDIYSNALIDPELAEQAHQAFERLQARQPSTGARVRPEEQHDD